MFPQFASTAASFTRASSVVLRVGTDAHLYDDPQDADITTLLDSKFDAEKAEGIKRLLALMSQGCDVSPFFPTVVKNVASPSLEVKKLVYIYLVHYAEKRPDEALLSINSFQKDLADPNPLVRAWALRALSGIKVHAVAPLMLMAVNKCVRDPSAYVRRVAANAIPKLYLLDNDTHDSLEKLIGLLLDDSSVGVIGAAAAAFVAVCPECYFIVASRFCRLCEVLPDLEEWGQVVLIETLLRYVVARHGLQHFSDSSSSKCNEDLMIDTHPLREVTDEANEVQKDTVVSTNVFTWLDSNTGTSKHSSGPTKSYCPDGEDCKSVHDDVNLLLRCTSPLLWSHNSAVVLAAATVYWFLAPIDKTREIVKPLIFLLRSFYDAQYVVLLNLVAFVQDRPSLFEAYYEDFFVRSSDSQNIRSIKLDILSLIAEESSIQAILQELQAYVRDPDRQFAADAVHAIGRCARKLPSIALKCLNGLLVLVRDNCTPRKALKATTEHSTIVKVTSSRSSLQEGILDNPRADNTANPDREAAVVTQAVRAIRAVLEQHLLQSEKVFAQLVRNLGHIIVPSARAIIIWMIGEYGWRSTHVCQMIPLIFKYFAASFVREDTETKLQILNCVSKIIVCYQATSDPSMMKTASSSLAYLLDLGSNDINYDVRDRARMLRHLIAVYQKYEHTLPKEQILSKELKETHSHEKASSFSNISENFLALVPVEVLLSPKHVPVASFVYSKTNFLPGSMSYIVNHTAPGYRPLPKPLSFQEKVSTCGDSDLEEEFSESQVDETISELESEEARESGTDSDGSASSRTCSSESVGKKSNPNYFITRSYGSQSGSASASYVHSSIRSELSNERQHSGSIAETRDDTSRYDSREIDKVGLLISLSDTEIQTKRQNSGVEECKHKQDVDSTLLLRSSEDLESWLGPPHVQNVSSLELKAPTGFVNLSLGNICLERKKKILLDFTNGQGLEVKYSFSFTASIYSQSMVCIRLYFYNRSSESFSSITVKSIETDSTTPSLLSQRAEDSSRYFAVGKGTGAAKVIPLQEIENLHPGQLVERNLHVDFFHHLLPIKLGIYFNETCIQVKLVPETGALLKPVALSAEDFASAEVGLSGMLESVRRCIFKKNFEDSSISNIGDEIVSFANSIASRVLQYANVSLVSATIPVYSGASVIAGDRCCIHLRFSGETLMGSLLCLVTISVEATGSQEDSNEIPVYVKVNCEDTVFGLSLLKQLDEALSAVDGIAGN